jgi:hypothetical protein
LFHAFAGIYNRFYTGIIVFLGLGFAKKVFPPGLVALQRCILALPAEKPPHLLLKNNNDSNNTYISKLLQDIGKQLHM